MFGNIVCMATLHKGDNDDDDYDNDNTFVDSYYVTCVRLNNWLSCKLLRYLVKF